MNKLAVKKTIDISNVIIIGSGPAGYTAGIYCGRAALDPIIYEGENWGGQLTTTSEVENFPGFSSIGGYDLVNNMREQCITSGCTLLQESVTNIKLNYIDNIHLVNDKLTRCVIIATGATAKRLHPPSFEESDITTAIEEDIYWNHGISACAVCDGALPMFRNKPIAVIGGGDSACEEALFLTKFASIVYLLVRSDKLRASAIMQKRVNSNAKIIIRYLTSVTKVIGSIEPKIRLKYIELNTQPSETLEVSGMFYGIGHEPSTAFLNGQLELDDGKYIMTKNTCTNVKGVFACGDVQDKIYRQAITAAGSGCMAAMEAEYYLSCNGCNE